MRQFMQGAKTCGKNPKAHSAVCLQEPRNNKNSTRRVWWCFVCRGDLNLRLFQ